MYIVLLGAPGAGKGTQAALLSAKLGLPHVATGDLFREALSRGTRLGLVVKPYMEKGQLVPDEVTIELLLERISSADCRGGAILDGFPRSLAQARALDEALARRGTTVGKVLLIDVPTVELVSRISGRRVCPQCKAVYHVVSSPPRVEGRCDRCAAELIQRADDRSEVVEKRLKVYSEQTAPLIEYYRGAGKLASVDGGQGVEGVMRDLLYQLGRV